MNTSMQITTANDNFIIANDQSGAFSINKRDGTFSKSFVSPVPLKNGQWFVFGNTHSGTCAKSPFN